MMAFRSSLAVLLIAVFSLAALAEEHAGKPERPARSEQGVPYPNVTGQNGPGVLSLLPPDSVTEHAIETPAGKLAYTATAGTFSLFDQSGERSAAIFYTAFVAKTSDKTNDPARPVTFVFNGGPGSGLGFSQSRARGSAHRGVRQRLRRRARSPHRQPGHLARFHRSRDDRSGRHRLEPGRQA